jgi:hypothetical protein
LNSTRAVGRLKPPNCAYGSRIVQSSQVARVAAIRRNLVVGERIGQGLKSAAQLSTIPDADELRMIDEAIVRADRGDGKDVARNFCAKIDQMAVIYRDGRHPLDLAKEPRRAAGILRCRRDGSVGIRCQGGRRARALRILLSVLPIARAWGCPACVMALLLDISYESVRSWVLKFRPMIARRLRQIRPRPSDSMASRRDVRRDRGPAALSYGARRPRSSTSWFSVGESCRGEVVVATPGCGRLSCAVERGPPQVTAN